MKVSEKVLVADYDRDAPVEPRRCPDCGGAMHGSRQVYHYKECGLSSVKLKNVVVYDCSCGSRVPEIPAIEELHTLIALDLLQKKSLLSGEEIQFLRKMAGLTQKELAEIMGTEKTRPSKWESGGLPIGKENDRVLRSCCLFGMIQHILGEEDPVDLTRSAADVIRRIDVIEIFRHIKDQTSASKTVSVEKSRRSEASQPEWFLPSETKSSIHVN